VVLWGATSATQRATIHFQNWPNQMFWPREPRGDPSWAVSSVRNQAAVRFEALFFLQRRLVSPAHGLLGPIRDLFMEFQAEGESPISRPFAINHARGGVQLSIRGLDQQPLIWLSSLLHQHTESKRADVLGCRALRGKRLLETGDSYGNSQRSPFYKSPRPHRHLVIHLPNCLLNQCTGLVEHKNRIILRIF